MYHIFFIHSSVDGHLGYCLVLAIANSAAVTKSRVSCAELGAKSKVVVRLWPRRMHFTVEVAVICLLEAGQSLITGGEEFLLAVLRLWRDFKREIGEQSFQESPDFGKVGDRIDARIFASDDE